MTTPAQHGDPTEQVALISCHLIYGLQAAAAIGFFGELVKMVLGVQRRAEGIIVVGLVLLFCLLFGYAVRYFIHRFRPTFDAPWLVTHLKFQALTFWIALGLFLPVIILMGFALIASAMALLYRSLYGWLSLAKHQRLVSHAKQQAVVTGEMAQEFQVEK